MTAPRESLLGAEPRPLAEQLILRLPAGSLIEYFRDVIHDDDVLAGGHLQVLLVSNRWYSAALRRRWLCDKSCRDGIENPAPAFGGVPPVASCRPLGGVTATMGKIPSKVSFSRQLC